MDLPPAGAPRPRRSALIALIALAIGLVGSAIAAVGLVRTPSRSEREVTPRGPLHPHEIELTQLFQRVSRSVVHIKSLQYRRSFTRDVYRVPEGSGSGFVWDRDGHIVTNFHVVQNGSAFEVLLADGTAHAAQLVGVAPHKDLAVLAIQAPAEALSPIDLGTSHDLLVGQTVHAIGNPFGLDQSLTSGVISALGREITSKMRTTIYDVIQSDTAVNPGNSGGPLLDSAGRLIGVNTAIFSPSGVSVGISFAIPVDTVRRVVPDLIEYGRVQKPVIGFAPYPQPLPRHFPRGVLVLEVPENSELEDAGLRGTTEARLGDIIVAVNDRPTPTRAELESVLERFRPGDEARLKVIRGLSFEGEGGREHIIVTRLQEPDEPESP
jgi:S1-C subfamily serine protease